MTASSASTRILIIAPQPFYDDRGTPIAIRRLLEALSERGDRVDLLTYPMGQNVELPGLNIIRIPNIFGIRQVPIGFSLRKLLLDLTMMPIVFARLRREHYSSIHAVEESAFLAVLAARKRGIPVIYDMQSSLPEQLAQFRMFRSRPIQRWFRSLERWLIRNSAHVVCSAGLRKYVVTVDESASVEEWHFPATKRTVPADELRQLRAELGLTSDNRVILYSGTFEPYQGIVTVLRAAHAVLAEIPDAVFVFVGADGKADFSLGPDAEALAGKGALRIVARRPRTEIDRYLAIADLLVSPRMYGKNLPLKIYDYMAAGKPIVASDCAAHRTILDDSRAVLVGASPAEWSSAMIRLLRGQQETEKLVNAAQEFADRQLGWTAFQQKVWALHSYP